MIEETRKLFHQELEAIRAEIAELASLVTDALPKATQALLDGDLAAAQRVIDSDDEMDALTLRIEERCYSTLALQNPVSKDLRAVITATWLSGELERSGDLAVNICKAARRVFGITLDPKLSRLISSMSGEAVRLMGLAVDAYMERNAGLAAALDDMDDRLDELHVDYIETIFETTHDLGDLQPAVQLALIGRYYERIGDHAVNIGERVHYMVTGQLEPGPSSGSAGPEKSPTGTASPSAIVVGSLAVDPARHEVMLDGNVVKLPLQEFKLLTTLANNAGRVLTRDTLIHRVWGSDYVGDTKTLDVHVKRLRAKLETNARKPERIVTIRGVGYKLVKPD